MWFTLLLQILLAMILVAAGSSVADHFHQNIQQQLEQSQKTIQTSPETIELERTELRTHLQQQKRLHELYDFLTEFRLQS